jgi:REP element-mobilizing transposase RayT
MVAQGERSEPWERHRKGIQPWKGGAAVVLKHSREIPVPHSYTQLLYHLVFSTKKRRPLITSEVAPHLYAYLGGAINDEGGQVLLINGTADHTHIFARLRQDKSVANVLRAIKANSSGWMHREYPQLDFAWQEGYGAFSVSQSQSERLKKYIQNQEKHHRKMTFEEEFIALLEAHGVVYKKAYVFD